MLIRIRHITEYAFASPVFFEPHVLRFRPKETPDISVREFHFTLKPEPSGQSQQMDVEGNHTILCWFENTHDQMRIEADSVVEVKEFNPFNFLINPSEYLTVPFEYGKKTRQLLNQSLATEAPSEAIKVFVMGVAKQSDHGTVSFLASLTREIHKDFVLMTRETGRPHSPEYTFAQKKGSCRDLAWMEIHMLRQMGIAARFVSGYYFLNMDNPEYELHAWVEAYLPGAGWIGLDPGHGILTNCFHIPAASSAFYEFTMPVTGTIRGSARSTMRNELAIRLDP